MCGEVEVPEEHLEVCRVCNAFGQNCQSHESSKPAGPGKIKSDRDKKYLTLRYRLISIEFLAQMTD